MLKIFKKKENNDFQTKVNGDQFSIKFGGKNNTIIDVTEAIKKNLNLGGNKYALFEIKKESEETVYLYCSDVDSIYVENREQGIFGETHNKSISIIACDTSDVTDMGYMFSECSNLTDLNLQIFDTKNVGKMAGMFYNSKN